MEKQERKKGGKGQGCEASGCDTSPKDCIFSASKFESCGQEGLVVFEHSSEGALQGSAAVVFGRVGQGVSTWSYIRDPHKPYSKTLNIRAKPLARPSGVRGRCACGCCSRWRRAGMEAADEVFDFAEAADEPARC